ncbi:hypothetical protein [Methylobacterium sp. WL7]|uniref:hypothetical protein n=1 Tax=Methylobacterium sp. WL7 TaxID=2603900 RepID=UPI0011C71180|nr:hypothetical protein [Methylobacterium sp. WL7]TXN43796.1 hypothetical protein FV233_17125 [Methylobacterium sp. WL7]
MTDLLDKAVAKTRDLAPEMQDEIARVMLAFIADASSVYRFTPEEEAEQDAADAAVARGDFATDAKVRAIRAKHGLCGCA